MPSKAPSLLPSNLLEVQDQAIVRQELHLAHERNPLHFRFTRELQAFTEGLAQEVLWQKRQRPGKRPRVNN